MAKFCLSVGPYTLFIILLEYKRQKRPGCRSGNRRSQHQANTMPSGRVWLNDNLTMDARWNSRRGVLYISYSSPQLVHVCPSLFRRGYMPSPCLPSAL